MGINMTACKVYSFNLKFTIATSQLEWTHHGKQRLDERGVELPRFITSWEMIDYRWDDKFGYPAITLRHRRKGYPDVIIVVTKAKTPDKYVVITTYNDGRAAI